MADFSRAEGYDFLEKVRDATDDVSDAKVIEEVKGLIEAKPELLKARCYYSWNCFYFIKSVELAGFIYKRDPSLINERDIYGRFPIHSAAMTGRLPIVKFIVEKLGPAMIHATSTYGSMTPLTNASFNGKSNVVEWIVTRDPSTANHVDSDGRTALHLVAFCETRPDALECAKLLLKVNAEMRWAQDRDGRTPVMLAQRQNRNSELTLFLESLAERDETIAEAKSFWGTVNAMLLAMEADKRAKTLDSMAMNTKKTAMDAFVVVAEWTKNMAVSELSDIFSLIQS